MRNKILQRIIPVAVLIFLSFVAMKRTDGFKVHLITKYDKVDKKWAMAKPDNIEEIKDILSHEFNYLTRGRECFIFESEDQKYILKFFNSARYDTTNLFPKVFLPDFLNKYRSKHYNRRVAKLNFNLSSTRLAFEKLREGSALVYVNLSKTDIFQNRLQIKNKYGKRFYIDLNDKFFILQKKCRIFYQEYEKSSDLEYKKYLLMAFLEMVHKRTKQLIIDDDIGKKRRNWGLYDNQAVTIDIGRWYFDEKLQFYEGYKKEMLKATKILRKYLKEKEPQNLVIVNKRLEKYFKDFK